MLDSKLIQTIKTFSKDEFKLFKKFIESPYFNNGRNYIPLYGELKKYYPDFQDSSLTFEKIYTKLYPGKKFNKQVMWNQVSQLEKLAVEFILQTGLKNSNFTRFELLFREFSNRGLNKRSSKEIESIEKSITSLKKGKDYFFLRWNIENSKVVFWNKFHGRQDKGIEGTVSCTEYLLLNFLVDLSVQAWDLMTSKVMYYSGNEINYAIELVKSLELKNLVDTAVKNKNKYSSEIKLYYHKIMCALEDNSEVHFFEMKKYFDENYHMLDPKEQSNTIISLANYCAIRMRRGDQKYIRILFEINKFRLSKEIDAYVNSRINKALYHQILRNALLLGETEWAENFVNEYTPKLKVVQQKTMNALANGLISFAKKDFAASIDFVNKVEFIDIRDKLHVRILSAMAYYELNNFEYLFYFIDSSKHFIRNSDNIESETKLSRLNFFNFLNRILILKEEGDKTNKVILKKEIESDKSLRGAHKNWLLDKTDQM